MKTLSEKNPYYLPKYRRLEMQYLALQYNYYKEEVKRINLMGAVNYEKIDKDPSDPVWTAVQRRAGYQHIIDIIDKALESIDEKYRSVIKESVITDKTTYTYLYTHDKIDCTEKHYYHLRQRFYWVLSGLRH